MAMMNLQTDFIFSDPELKRISDKYLDGNRLDASDGVALFNTNDINGLAQLANYDREKRHGADTYFVRNLHINYTNVCMNGCRFCSFHSRVNGPTPYTLDYDAIINRIARYHSERITEVHIVGGINGALPYEYYIGLLDTVKSQLPNCHIKAFTAVELQHIADISGQPLPDVLSELKSHGLESVPGGGVEVANKRIHDGLFPRKLTAEAWREVSKCVAEAGLTQYATMLYGHIETIEERVDHLLFLRDLQDECSHFVTFTPLAFHPEDTLLSHLPHTSALDDLKVIAVSRLMLDNIPHIKTFWVMNTPKISQTALWYGADDMDGTVLRYEITYADDKPQDSNQGITYRQMLQLIRETGRVPIERDSFYNSLPLDEEITIDETRTHKTNGSVSAAVHQICSSRDR